MEARLTEQFEIAGGPSGGRPEEPAAEHYHILECCDAECSVSLLLLTCTRRREAIRHFRELRAAIPEAHHQLRACRCGPGNDPVGAAAAR